MGMNRSQFAIVKRIDVAPQPTYKIHTYLQIHKAPSTPHTDTYPTIREAGSAVLQCSTLLMNSAIYLIISAVSSPTGRIHSSGSEKPYCYMKQRIG
jgi:hypothetical protein